MSASLLTANGHKAMITSTNKSGSQKSSRSCSSNASNILRRRHDKTKKALKNSWRGDLTEEPKIVIQGPPTCPPSKRRAYLVTKQALVKAGRVWRQCWAHFMAIASTVTLAYLNIAGYFVGNDLQGSPSDNYQAFYRLCLQITAKVLVGTTDAATVNF